jgi:ABC-type Fe3+-hydroxamate transport system substrate-binding protein
LTRLALVALLALAVCGGAQASWSVGVSGSAASAAKTMPAGTVPSGSVAGNSVTVTWAASTFAGGGAVPGYVVRRFNDVGGAEATVLAACAGIVSGTSCTEDAVPIGVWRYTVTPAAGSWRGTQSAQSPSVTVLL